MEKRMVGGKELRRFVFWRWLIATVLLAVIIFFGMVIIGGRYTEYFPVEDLGNVQDASDLVVSFEPQGIMELNDISVQGDHVAVAVTGVAEGETVLTVKALDGSGSSVDTTLSCNFAHKIRNGINLNFAGQRILVICTFIYSLYLVILTGYVVVRAWRMGLFSHTTIYVAGLHYFARSLTVTQGYLVLMVMTHPEDMSFQDCLTALASSNHNYLYLMTPLIAAFGIGLIVSNIVLLTRERVRLNNMLGIIAGVILLGAEAVELVLQQSFPGSQPQDIVGKSLFNIYAGFFIYGISMLRGAAVCAMMAARHEPAHDKDYVIILGCRVRPDGTLYPLIRSRVDRAIKFAKDQLAEAGWAPVLVPSGGHGTDETLSEGDAMGRYILEQGTPAEQLLIENRAATTKENMSLSMALVREKKQEPRVIFSTSGYHVLRSELIAREQGMEMEGIGAPCKWYFWPNAFLREAAGVFLSRVKANALMLVIFAACFVLLSIVD